MMSKKQFKELMSSLENLNEKLEILVSIQRASAPKPKIGREERKVLNLCDRKHTANDMIQKTGKTYTNVNSMLSQLRRKGLIRSVKLKGRLVYEKI